MIISFFYAEKLMECGLDPQWMSPIILLYSLVGMLADPILRRLRSVPAGRVIAVFCALAAGALVLFTFLRRALPVTILMVILPLLLDIPGCCLAREENVFVDRFSGGENRAAVLSALNMGVNLVEILALFASAALTGIGLSVCFLAAALALLLCGGRFAAKDHTVPGTGTGGAF